MKWEITLALVLCFFSMANSLSSSLNLVHQQPLNLIVNGDFSNPIQGSGWTIADGINGWIALPTMELGIGSTYNSNWGSTRVTELDINYLQSNTIISQVVYGLKQDLKCTLSYSWAARTRFPKESSQFTVTWNGHVVQIGRPDDYDLHNQSFQVTTYGFRDIVVFIGQGTTDGGGATIGNVSLTCP